MLTLFRVLFSPPRHMILLVIATWVGLTLAEKRSEGRGVGRDDLNNIIFYGLIAFVIGGRLSFILQNFPAFLKSPIGIISVNPELFDLSGAVVMAIIVAFIYGQARGLALWHTLDALTPFFAVLAIGSGLAHLAAGTAFGKATELPWGIDLWNAQRHPTQIYETLAALLIFFLPGLKRRDPRPGTLFLTFAALTSISQLFIQGFRADSPLILNGLRQEQVIAWLALAIIFSLFEYRWKENK